MDVLLSNLVCLFIGTRATENKSREGRRGNIKTCGSC